MYHKLGFRFCLLLALMMLSTGCGLSRGSVVQNGPGSRINLIDENNGAGGYSGDVESAQPWSTADGSSSAAGVEGQASTGNPRQKLQQWAQENQTDGQPLPRTDQEFGEEEMGEPGLAGNDFAEQDLSEQEFANETTTESEPEFRAADEEMYADDEPPARSRTQARVDRTVNPFDE